MASKIALDGTPFGWPATREGISDASIDNEVAVKITTRITNSTP